MSRVRRSHPVAAALAVLSLLALANAPQAFGQTCGVTGGGQQQMPPFTGTSFGLTSTGGGNQHLYAVTEWGISRFSLANPAAPAGGSTGMIGIDFSQGSAPDFNGGKVPVTGDSHQGPTWFAVAESSDGTARAVTDWSPALNQGDIAALQGQVVMSAGNGSLSFGQQLNVPRPLSSGQPIAVATVGGAFYSYSSTPNGLSIANVSSPTGMAGEADPYRGPVDPAAGIQPLGSFNNWGPLDTLTVATVNVAGVPTMLLVGTSLGSLHVGRINANGTVTDSGANVVLAGGFAYSVSVANVGTKAVIFTAEGASGIRGYEFTGTSLVLGTQSIAGNFDYVVARGSYPSLIIVAHKSFGQMETYDTKWMLTGGTPIAGPVSQHNGSPNNYFGKWAEAVVVGNTAYLYRVGNGLPEKNLYTTILDVSCITADLTSPPTASATFLNKSAQSRSGVESTINYYGDRLTFTDASASGTPITRVDWDLNTAGASQTDFVPDVGLGTGTSIGGSSGLVFPCDPNGPGSPNPATGANCNISVGLTATPGPASFKFGEKSSNVNGAAANAFFSPAISFVMPQAKVANMVGSTLAILTGGSADSSPTQGHPVSWQWSFSGGSGGSSTLPVAPVPNGTTSFSLTVGYEGGYSASTTGNVTITDLVPSFSSPATANLGTAVTLTNTMQIATGGVVTSVYFSLVSGACPGTPSFTGSLAASFNSPGGTATVTAPATAGPYCITLRYHYTPFQGTPTISPTQPTANLTVANAQLNANVNVNPASVAANAPTTITITVSGGVPPYFYAYDCNYSTFSGGNFGSPSSSNTSTCSWPTAGGHTPGVKITDSNTPASNITVFGNATVTGGGGGQISASISGNPTPSVGVATTYTANASGGSGSYSYAWACDYTPLAGTGQFVTGSVSNPCTWGNTGARQVGVRVTDSNQASGIGTYSVNVGGGTPGPGGLGVNVTGATTGSQNQAITYTATGTGGTPPYTFQWSCDYSASFPSFSGSGSTHPCTYTTNGPHITAAKVTDATSATAIGTMTTTISGPPLPSVAFTVTGGTISGSTVTVGLNQPVTFTSSEANCTSWGWAFGDGTAGTGQSITKTYSAKGTFTGQLVVVGNGTGAQGTNVAAFTVVVVTPAPSGAFTITGAQANANGTVFTANAGDTLTMSAAEAGAITWGWDFGDGTLGSARSVTKAYGALGSYTVKLFVTGNERDTTGLTISTFTINVVSCVTNASTLCLNSNRFRANVDWSVPDQGKNGAGSANALTGDTGYYWFFSPANIEVVLKVVDGRAFNGNFWVFYGALSDVQYDISIKDTSTGVVKTYHNPYHTTASVADVNAFPSGTSSAELEAKKTKAASAVSVACTPTTVTVGQPITCTASPAGTYTWEWGETFPLQFAPGPNPNTHTYNSIGTRTITVTPDGGTTQGSTTVAITAGGGGTITASITGPSTGTTGTAVTFTGTGTGGTAPYTYAWNCEYTATNPSFTSGTATNPCTYTTTGVHTVGLKVTDSATPAGSGIGTATITISAPAGPGLPSAAFTISGATLNSTTNRYETEIGRSVTFTATETHAASWGWAFGDGATSGGPDPVANRVVTYAYPQGGNFTGQLIVQGDGTNTVGYNLGSIPMSVLRCAGDSETLCLNNGRFKVKVAWRSADSSGIGTAVPVTADTGQFWFITANNIELVLKVVDGTSFNGHFWVFYGALSNLEYDITVTDTTTGAVKTYHNPLGTTASLADVNAF